MSTNKFFAFYRKYGIFIILLVVLAFFSAFADNFLSFDNLLTILRQISMLGIATISVSLIMISGGMDLSVGGQIAVGGIISAWLMVDIGLPIWLVVIISMCIGVLFGVVNGWIAVKLNVYPLIVTLGTMLVLQGLAYVITGGYPIYGLPENYKLLGQGYWGVIPIPVICFLLVVLASWFLLNKTYFGRHIYAVGGNPEAARLAGVDVERFRIVIYALGSFFTSIASLIMLSRTNSAQPAAGENYPFDCMTAAVLGGVSTIGGEGKIGNAFVGVLIIGILNNGLLLMGVNSNWQDVVKGIVLIAAVGIDCVQRKPKKMRVETA